ncbi:MAG: acyltransferase [Acidimicrobiales bacterium]|jgi:acetyltransferase-like isoleucine patch superfamily enzyme
MNMLGQGFESGSGIRVPPSIRALAARYRHLLPATRYAVDPALVWIIVTHLSIVRSLVLSVRFGGWFLVSRRTRIKIGRRSKVTFGPGSFLFVGFLHYGPTPAAIHIGRGATLSVEGTVLIRKASRVFVHDGAHLEMHPGSIIADCSTVTCFEHIVFGAGGGVAWYCNVLDTNGHVVVVNGDHKPLTSPVVFGPHVLVGSYATILPGVTLGEGSVIAAGSVVTKDVPPHSLVGGNPARVLRQDVEWID